MKHRLRRIVPVEQFTKTYSGNTRVTHQRLSTLIRTLYQQSKDEIWLLVRLHQSVEPAPRLLRKTGVSIEEARRWTPVMPRDVQFDFALQLLRPVSESNLLLIEHDRSLPTPTEQANSQAVAIQDDGASPQATVPTWLILRLIYRKVRTATHAARAWDLILQHLPHASPERHAPILLVSAHVLLSHGLFNPVKDLVAIFLALPIFHESFHINLLLQVLSSYCTTPESGLHISRLCVRILEALENREMALSHETYRILLSNRYITMHLTNALQARTLREGKVPDVKQLEAYARIYARQGKIHHVNTYVEAVRIMLNRLDKPAASSAKRSPPSHVHDFPAAFVYLEKLVRDTNTIRHPAERQNLNHGIGPHAHSRKRFDPAQWAARLYAISRDRYINSAALISHFRYPEQFPQGFRWRKPLFYTIVINGLLHRRSPGQAYTLWKEYRQSDLWLDRPSLIIGIRVLTRNGLVEEALQLVEEAYQAACAGAMPTPKRLESQRSIFTPERTLPASVMTKLMAGLVTYCGRPDIVWYLWENMELLYGTKPDGETLTALIIAAREASASFETISGAIREMRMDMRAWNPFRSSNTSSSTDDFDAANNPPHPPEQTTARSLISARQDAYEGLLSLLHPSVVPTDTWSSQQAYRLARSIFRRILFTNHPELYSVQSPAQSIRRSRNDIGNSPLLDLKRTFLPSRQPIPNTAPNNPNGIYIPPPSLFPSSQKSPGTNLTPLLRTSHPSILPSARAFNAYILLLGSFELASEIPLALAWMRELDVTPTKRTIALALVYWSEISLRAPLIEAFSASNGGLTGSGSASILGVGGVGVGGIGVGGRRAASPYGVLLVWLEGWLGSKRMPGDREFGAALREVDRLRRRRRDKGRGAAESGRLDWKDEDEEMEGEGEDDYDYDYRRS
ncbi:uncharacterized protein STEHIDRAFT_82319 [Stereum hirsutum FP-91666 SS1]|uniref:uncharacterized protein n=1 Tax=Stereum hirsutum (strain FP-91666) TaxID=721885 RepID=UPI0004449D0C|nr:uncharacterized protein STEHIDRAFT_82319 [Stereum hirsutum FP-91666 SS1]EIM84398.1 hypothetical protein STEHIDRAFT_82319 [Stereum hirsutum FP-91666 SS1]